MHGVVAGGNIEQGKRWAFKMDMIMNALAGHSSDTIIIICDVDTNFLHLSVERSLRYYMESGKGRF